MNKIERPLVIFSATSSENCAPHEVSPLKRLFSPTLENHPRIEDVRGPVSPLL